MEKLKANVGEVVRFFVRKQEGTDYELFFMAGTITSVDGEEFQIDMDNIPNVTGSGEFLETIPVSIKRELCAKNNTKLSKIGTQLTKKENLHLKNSLPTF